MVVLWSPLVHLLISAVKKVQCKVLRQGRNSSSASSSNHTHRDNIWINNIHHDHGLKQSVCYLRVCLQELSSVIWPISCQLLYNKRMIGLCSAIWYRCRSYNAHLHLCHQGIQLLRIHWSQRAGNLVGGWPSVRDWCHARHIWDIWSLHRRSCGSWGLIWTSSILSIRFQSKYDCSSTCFLPVNTYIVTPFSLPLGFYCWIHISIVNPKLATTQFISIQVANSARCCFSI